MDDTEGAPIERREPVLDPARRRVFILTSGRSGSTLLASVLADAGADFGMATPERWDPGTGDLEHPDLHRMRDWMGYAYSLSPDRPGIGLHRYLWDIYRSMGKARLKRLLREAVYVKGEGADFAVQPAFKMGFFPTIIINYRRFEDFAISSGTMRGHSNLESLVRYYSRVNRNALLMLRIFGGCVVGYDQLTDPQDASWVEPLAAATGLPLDRLMAARDRRLGSPSRGADTPSLDASAAETFASIDALRGSVIPPSSQALRSWRKSRSRHAVPAASSDRAKTDAARLTSSRAKTT